MKSAEFFVDILIVGFLALLWICGFVFTFIIGDSNISQILLNISAAEVVFMLLVIYVFGILFDYINSFIFSLFKSREEKELYKGFSIAKIIIQNDKIYSIIEIYYGRLRILRSFICSIPLITWAVSCYLYYCVIGLKVNLSETLIMTILSGIIFFVLALISYQRRNGEYKNYISELKSFYINPKQPQNTVPCLTTVVEAKKKLVTGYFLRFKKRKEGVKNFV